MAGNMDDTSSDVVDVGDNNSDPLLSWTNPITERAINRPYQGIVGTHRPATQTSDGTTQRPSAETDQGMQVTVTSTIHQVSPRLTTCSSTTVSNISVASVDTLHQNQQHPLLRTWTASTWSVSNAQATISSMPPPTEDYGQLRTDSPSHPGPPADASDSHFYSNTNPSLLNHLQQRYSPPSAGPNIDTHYRFSTPNSSALALPQTASLQSFSNFYDGVSTVVSTSAAAVSAPHSHVLPSSCDFTLSHVSNTISSVCHMPILAAEPSSYSQLPTSQLPTILPNCPPFSVDTIYFHTYGSSHPILQHQVQQRTNYRYDINDQVHHPVTPSNSPPMAQPPISRQKLTAALYQNTSTQNLEMDTVTIKVQCPFCNLLFPQPEYSIHVQNCRDVSPLLKCEEKNCRAEFFIRRDLIRHILDFHGYSLACPFCSREYSEERYLRDHQRRERTRGRANSCYVPSVTFPVSRAPLSRESPPTWVISSGSATQHTTTPTQPTTTSTQSTTTSTQPPTTSTQPTTTSTQSTTTSTQPTTTFTQPTTTSTQPTTTSTQPTTTSTQPTTTATQPTTTSIQPTTTSTQPTTTSTQPPTTSIQSATTSTQPTATDMDNLLNITSQEELDEILSNSFEESADCRSCVSTREKTTTPLRSSTPVDLSDDIVVLLGMLNDSANTGNDYMASSAARRSNEENESPAVGTATALWFDSAPYALSLPVHPVIDTFEAQEELDEILNSFEETVDNRSCVNTREKTTTPLRSPTPVDLSDDFVVLLGMLNESVSTSNDYMASSAARRDNEENESSAVGTVTASWIESTPYDLSSPVHLVVDTFEAQEELDEILNNSFKETADCRSCVNTREKTTTPLRSPTPVDHSDHFVVLIEMLNESVSTSNDYMVGSAARKGNEERETESYALGNESPAGGTATASWFDSAPYDLSSPVHPVIDTLEGYNIGPIHQQPLPPSSADDALEEYLARKKSSAAADSCLTTEISGNLFNDDGCTQNSGMAAYYSSTENRDGTDSTVSAAVDQPRTDNVMSQTSSQQRQQMLIDEEQDVIHVCPLCCESIVDGTHICALQPS